MNFSSFIYRFRWPVIILAWVISIGFAFAIPSIRIDPDVKALIPSNMPTKINTDKIEEIFGGSDMIMVIMETGDILAESSLKRLQQIDEGFRQLPDIDRTLSLFSMKSISGDSGNMVVTPAITEIPQTADERAALKKELAGNKLVIGTAVSSDFRLAAIIGTIRNGADNKILMESIKAIVAAFPGSETIHYGGFPVVKQSITDNILKDLKYLMPMAIVLMLVILWLSFRDLKGVLLPLSVVLLAMILCVGLIPLLGWKFALVTVLLPIMMIAIGNNYGIYLVNRYQEILKHEPNIPTTRLMTVLSEALSRPIMLCALTTIAGVLALLTHIIVPAREVGLLAAIGIAWALILSLTYIPALLAILPRPKPGGLNKKPHITPLEDLLFRTGVMISRKPKTVLLVAGIVTIGFGIGMAKLTVEGDTVKFFSPKDPVRSTSELIDRHFGGSQSISIQFNGDIMDPVMLNRMLWYEESIKKESGVGQVVSVASVIRLMSRSILEPGDPGYDSIPATREGVAQYLELYNLSGDPSDFEQLVDFNYENAQVLVRISDASSNNVLKLADKIRTMTNEDPAVARIGGVGLISAELTDSLVTGQWRSTLLSLLIVCFLVGLIFKRGSAAFIVLVPLGMACFILFGIMGWGHIPFDPATTMITSVMLGCGVDYTVQFLWRLREETMAGLSPGRAVVKTLYTTGKAISFNALAVMVGFAPLIFSTFSPIRFFGIMMVVSIFACLVGALIVIPAVTLVVKPKFLSIDRL